VHGHAGHCLDPPLQVDAAPPHHPVPLRIGARLHQRGEFGPLVRRQPRRRAGRAAVGEPREPLGVVTMNPVPKGPPIHAAGLRRGRAVRALKNQRDRQHPPRRASVLRPPCRRTRPRWRQVLPRDLNGHPSLPAINSREAEFSRLVNNARVTSKGRWYQHVAPSVHLHGEAGGARLPIERDPGGRVDQEVERVAEPTTCRACRPGSGRIGPRQLCWRPPPSARLCRHHQRLVCQPLPDRPEQARRVAGQVTLAHLPLPTRVRSHERGVDRCVLGSHQPGCDAAPDRDLEQCPEHACVAEAAMPVLGEGGMVRNRRARHEPAEPAMGEAASYLFGTSRRSDEMAYRRPISAMRSKSPGSIDGRPRGL